MDKDKEIDLYSKYDFEICPNCGHEETSKFCPNCGQSNKDFNKPIKDIFMDLLDSINLDIRLINTLIPFFFKPGFLTEEYFKGRRKRYVPPMRMYVMASIIFFFLASKSTLDLTNEVNEKVDSTGFNLGESVSFNGEKSDTNIFTAQQIIQELEKDTTEDGEEVKEIINKGKELNDDREAFISTFFDYFSYTLFLLMPVFALLLMLVNRKNKKFYVNHLIFAINYHTFSFLIFSITMALAKYVLPESTAHYSAHLIWAIPIYLVVGMQYYYKRGWIKTIIKTILLYGAYFMITITVMILVIIATANHFDYM